MSKLASTALRSTPLRRRTTLGGRRVRASEEQRAKVARALCLVCGREPVDPAHLVPQRFGGCQEGDCVVPLCRAHHRLFDGARLALAPYLDRELFAAHARARSCHGRSAAGGA